jgi:hypothetical protein
MAMKLFLCVLASLLPSLAGACPWCRPRVQAGIYTPAYSANLVLVLLPVVVLLALGVGIFYWDKLRFYFTSAYADRS